MHYGGEANRESHRPSCAGRLFRVGERKALGIEIDAPLAFVFFDEELRGLDSRSVKFPSSAASHAKRCSRSRVVLATISLSCCSSSARRCCANSNSAAPRFAARQLRTPCSMRPERVRDPPIRIEKLLCMMTCDGHGGGEQRIEKRHVGWFALHQLGSVRPISWAFPGCGSFEP